MEATHDHKHAHDSHGHDHGHDDHHDHKLPFYKKYIFSTDHKVIGMQYGLSGLLLLAFGFMLMLVMRWSIAHPGEALPGGLRWILHLFGPDFVTRWAPNGVVSGSLYNMFGAMHGTIMVFFGVVPLGFAAFVNFVTPLQVGAPDMAFPRLNMWSFWLFLLSAVLMVGSFVLPTGAAQAGWTNYSPLSATVMRNTDAHFWTGQTQWLFAMVFNISASLLGAVNVLTTVINLRAKGMTWMRLPFFTWAMFIIAFLLLLAFPPLEVAALMQLSDQVFGSSFFLPTGLWTGQTSEGILSVSGGGHPVLFQHLFWFLAHPEVYVLLLPGIAIVSEIIPCNTRKPIWGYKSMVYALLVLAFLSFIVWAHHMYLTGMGTVVATFFQFTTVMISIPSVILLTCLMISLWGGSIRFPVPMLFATAFLPMFGIGGLTGLPLAFPFIDLFLHDTYYVIAHFHYIVAPGVLFGLFAGVYHWFPKITGRMLSTPLGHLHFWGSLIGMNVLFAPMFVQGMAGFHRRWFDGGKAFENTSLQHFSFMGWEGTFLDMNVIISWGAWGLGLAQIPFIINFFWSIKGGKRVTSDNPWNATTLEWSTPTPPPHGNFLTTPVVYRGPYEYSVPGAERDFSPQWEPVTPSEEEALKTLSTH
ncbi:MAG TPA: cbb3-type cytochrome c oxidase subunit I [Verrucomicrobiales bacterium]|jgi:cytochrome c oxidase subunit 1|nr:cbb3-type cytochrome c oxidase subunit I [Verrucomicrobiales bacterium]